MHTYIHTCIHAYMHTCIYIYIYICIASVTRRGDCDNRTTGLDWGAAWLLFVMFVVLATIFITSVYIASKCVL